jgi:hypothetical protein
MYLPYYYQGYEYSGISGIDRASGHSALRRTHEIPVYLFWVLSDWIPFFRQKVRGLSGKYPAILNILRTGRMALV